jgi:hypothetical protein
MSYYINKTDGTAILVLDGTTDTISTSLSLIGKLASNYGEKQNENIVRLLENFAYNVSPANPIVGQLWYDTTTDNIKAYDGSVWVTVGSVIEGNVSLTGNLHIGSNNFRIQNLSGNASVINSSNNANIAFTVNVAGTPTTALVVNGITGLVTVAANATANLGVTTKLYVDSTINAAIGGYTDSLNAANVVIQANLASRVNEESALRANINAANSAILLRDTISRVNSLNDATNIAIDANIALINANLAVRVADENDLRANIEAANAAISSKDTIARVNSINTAINNAIVSNVNTINANIGNRVNTEIALDAALVSNNVSHSANVIAANAAIVTANTNLKNYVDGQITTLSTNVNTTYAAKASPALTGTPTAPTATFGSNTTQIATTQYVMTRSEFWGGSRKFVSTLDPTVGEGTDGDIWFKYIP